jgi:hypothetical protein
MMTDRGPWLHRLFMWVLRRSSGGMLRLRGNTVMPSIILLVFALVLFVLSGFLNAAVEPWRWRLACLGLACLAGAELVLRAGGGH